MNAKRETYNKTATMPTPDCRMTAEPKPTPPPPEVQDEIERAIRAGELPLQTTLAKWCFRNGKDCSIIFGDTTFALANPKLSGEYSRLTDERGNCWVEKCYWADPAGEKPGDTTPPDLEKSRELEEKANALDSQIDALGTMPLCQFYGITETAQPPTAQAADGDEIARKVADAVGDKLKPTLKYIADEAHGAKVAAEAAAKLIRGLRPEWLTGDKATPSEYIQIAGSIKMRIYELWKSYDHNPEDNGGRKADYATFYELNGGKEIRSGETLQSFIEDQAEKDRKNRTPEELIKRIIKSERERLRQSEEKQKTTSRQIRRK